MWTDFQNSFNGRFPTQAYLWQKNITSHLLNCISANARNVRSACSKCFRQLQCRLAVSLCHSLIPVSIALADQAHLKLCSQQTNSTQLNSTEPSAPESCTLATRLPSHPNNKVGLHNWHVIQKQRSPTFTVNTFIGIHAFRNWDSSTVYTNESVHSKSRRTLFLNHVSVV